MKIYEQLDIEYPIFLVSPDVRIINEIGAELANTSKIAKQANLKNARNLDQLVLPEVPCVVGILVDCRQFSPLKDFYDLHSQIEFSKAHNVNCTLVFFALVDDIGNSAVEHIVNHGFDQVFDVSQSLTLISNIVGFLRYIRLMKDFGPTGSPRTEIQKKLGDWTFDISQRSVKSRDGRRSVLSETEWDYLIYLYERDIIKSDVTEFTISRFEHNFNQKSLVYKIKKKLGKTFPIHASGGGKYRLIAT